MIEKIYLILTGEDEKKRPRSKKLLKEIKKEYYNKTCYDFKVIITGKSGFDFNRNPTQAENMREFLIKNSPLLESNIVLENEAIDTFGNMVFSYPILNEMIESSGDLVEVVLITEKFHMSRSRMLFNIVFGDLLESKKIRLTCKSAFTSGINLRFLKLHIHKFFNNLKQFNFDRKDIFYYLSKEQYLLKKDTKDFLIKEVLFLDLEVRYKNQLSKYEDYRNFLLNMPVYKKYYSFEKIKNIDFSLYKELIDEFILKK